MNRGRLRGRLVVKRPLYFYRKGVKLRVLGPHIFEFQAVGPNIHQDHGVGHYPAGE